MASSTKTLKIFSVVVSVLFICAIGYIVYSLYSQMQNQKQLSAFQQGAQYGYEQTILQIVQQSTACQQVPLYAENKTTNLIAVGC